MGNRTCDLPVCKAVLQTTASPRTPYRGGTELNRFFFNPGQCAVCSAKPPTPDVQTYNDPCTVVNGKTTRNSWGIDRN